MFEKTFTCGVLLDENETANLIAAVKSEVLCLWLLSVCLLLILIPGPFVPVTVSVSSMSPWPGLTLLTLPLVTTHQEI